MANFTGNKIKDTYSRVVQVDNGQFQDGLGQIISASLSGSFTGSFTGPTSSSLASRITSQENFSSSLNDTYASDAELATVSSSLATRVTSQEEFSASLNDTFATDAEVSTAVSSLNSATSSYALSANISGSFTSLSSSLETRVTSQEGFSASLNDTFATDAEVNTAVSSLNAATSSYALSANVVANTGTASFASTSSNIFDGDQTISASLAVSGTINTEFGNTYLVQNADRISLQAEGDGGGSTFSNISVQHLSDNTSQALVYADMIQFGVYNGDTIYIGNLNTVHHITGSEINFSGSLNVDHDVTASKYLGDGSTLTGIPTGDTISGSFVLNSQTGSFLTGADTGSFVTNSQTGSYQLIVTSSSPRQASYLIPTFITGSNGDSTFLTGSTYEDVSMIFLTWSGSNGTHTLTLPDASTDNSTYRSIRFLANGTVTSNDKFALTPSGSQLLDGSSSAFELDRSHEGIMIWSDGNNWYRIQSKA